MSFYDAISIKISYLCKTQTNKQIEVMKKMIKSLEDIQLSQIRNTTVTKDQLCKTPLTMNRLMSMYTAVWGDASIAYDLILDTYKEVSVLNQPIEISKTDFILHVEKMMSF
jgi:hypothetical protein